jgi:hypothetical protein
LFTTDSNLIKEGFPSSFLTLSTIHSNRLFVRFAVRMPMAVFTTPAKILPPSILPVLANLTITITASQPAR